MGSSSAEDGVVNGRGHSAKQQQVLRSSSKLWGSSIKSWQWDGGPKSDGLHIACLSWFSFMVAFKSRTQVISSVMHLVGDIVKVPSLSPRKISTWMEAQFSSSLEFEVVFVFQDFCKRSWVFHGKS